MKINLTYFTNLYNKDFKEWIEDEERVANALAKALKVLRAYHGYTLKQVGEGTDIPFQTIARYENGENIPGAIQLLKIASLYKFPLNNLFILGFIENIENNYKEILDKWDNSLPGG